MSAEATLYKDPGAFAVDATAEAAVASGEVLQLPDGRAAVKLGLLAAADGDAMALATEGQFTLLKTASVVILKGGRVFWDRSAGTATPLRAAAGGDFFIGVAVNDAASADTTVIVDFNKQPSYLVDLHRDAFDSATVLTAGTPTNVTLAGETTMSFSATNEAQKLDLLSRLSVPVAIPMILEAKFAIVTAADADVGDLSVGLANGTHASDADSITESAFFHQDSGADLNLDAECDDGTAAEVAATDTTVDVVAGTDLEVWIDARDLTDLKYYVNGVRVLSTTAFDIGDATGPLKALFHWEKSANDSLGVVRVSHLAIRAMDLAE